MHITYDDWKTTEPDAGEPTFQCECCGERGPEYSHLHGGRMFCDDCIDEAQADELPKRKPPTNDTLQTVVPDEELPF